MSAYDSLNPEQRKAVEQTEGPVLILAGAGSGKTRALTHRVAFLIDECGVNPWNILALTFTNKAAEEMKSRVDKIVGFGAESVWVSTFHSMCVRILRRHCSLLGYSDSFVIYDSDDQKNLIKLIMRSQNLEKSDLKPKNVINAISRAKDSLIGPDRFLRECGNDMRLVRIARAYEEYQKNLSDNNAMDFDDLIMKTVELFKKEPEILAGYQERFRYIHVDEYQDTNNAQFELVRLLADKYRNLCVVGDDDQSIYRFRGANIRNILDFEREYPDAAVIYLEQNYRSTGNILKAANAVIHNNVARKEKALWTDEDDGELIRFHRFDTAYDEAAYIAMQAAREKRQHGVKFSEMAVLYRTNAQSRVIEEKFVMEGIPYTLVGGVNFYARREIKDMLAYLRVIDNADDDLSVLRIINTPARGIGQTTLAHVRHYASDNDLRLFEALERADEIPGAERSAGKLKGFVDMIYALRTRAANLKLDDLMRDVINTINYDEYLEKLDDDDESGDNDRFANVEELISKMAEYQENSESPRLSEFLQEVALVTDADMATDDDRVTLMTLHGAKGLEFDHVTIAGMEEDIFPSYMSLQDTDPAALEEERRLAYVGITRARKKLVLSAARSRMLNGNRVSNRISRFVKEIPAELIADTDDVFEIAQEEVRPATDVKRMAPEVEEAFARLISSDQSNTGTGTAVSGTGRFEREVIEHEPGSSIYGMKKRPRAMMKTRKRAQPDKKPYRTGGKTGLGGLEKGIPDNVTVDYEPGDRVKHVKYGEGIVKTMEKGEKDTKVTVEFEEYGQKIMYARFAKLLKI
ncbi:MAG: UvrD-helicase domain-containing protein [Lachnospiraceae bacterium]|nr:UvrD-helicase domain-containing protein [Lachnospiraceae bacterium]